MHVALRRRLSGFALCAAVALASEVRADEPQGQVADLALSPAAVDDWRLDSTATLGEGELQLVGTGDEQSHAFYLPQLWADGALEASFYVEPDAQGVLACGFVVRAVDSATYLYVHYDRTQAILCRSDAENGWQELHRVGGLDKPAGAWHTARLEFVGEQLRVWLDDRLLYEAADPRPAAGRIGFYAGQGRVRVKDIRVHGAPQPAAAEFATAQSTHWLVCEDAGAGAYEAFPDVCRVGDELWCVFYAGYSHVALPNEQLPRGGRISSCVSRDEGRTWSAAETLHDGPDDDRDPSLVQLPCGRLLCTYFSLRQTEDANPGWTGLGSFAITSDDLGRTWSEPRPIAGDEYYCSSPVRVLPDGRLMLGLYYVRGERASGAVTVSTDRGESWSAPVDIDPGPYRLDAETDVIALTDGALLAALRGDGQTPLCFSRSSDGGATWSVAESSGFLGHCPYLHRLPQGELVLAHRQPNTSLHYSRDDGRTWSENVPVDSHIGAYPSLVNLRDGSTLIVYYEEGGGSNIRAKRFLLQADGVQWLGRE